MSVFWSLGNQLVRGVFLFGLDRVCTKVARFFVSIDFALYFHLVVVNLFKNGGAPLGGPFKKKKKKKNGGGPGGPSSKKKKKKKKRGKKKFGGLFGGVFFFFFFI